MAGTVKTGESAKVEFSLPEFHPDKLIEWRVHLTEKLGSYDMIIGRDILSEMGIDIHFSTHTCTWGHSKIPMRPSSVKIEQSYLVQESGPMKQATTRLKKILDAKYEAVDIPKIVGARKDLSQCQKVALESLLTKYGSLFDGTLGTWKNKRVHLQLKKDAQPYHTRPYQIPKSLEKKVRLEIERLCKLGVLKKVNTLSGQHQTL